MSGPMHPKSSNLNLYSPNGASHFETRVTFDGVEFRVSDLPLNLKAKQINLTNDDGQSITDVVYNIRNNEESIKSETNARKTEIATERSTRTSQEVQLQLALDAEINNRKVAIAADKDERNGAETLLMAAITEERNKREVAIAAEKTKREQDDTSLRSSVFDEKNLRTTNYSLIHQKIDDNVNDVSNVAAAHAQNIVSAFSSLDDKFTTMKQNTTGGDLNLRNALNDVNTHLSGLVSTETGVRTKADLALQLYIDDKVAELQNTLTTEKNRIDALLAGAPIDFDTFSKLASAYQSEDARLLARITALDQSQTKIQSEITQHEAILQTLVFARDSILQLGLTDNNLVTASTSFGNSEYKLFNNLYGAIPGEYGWQSHLAPQTLQIEGEIKTGHYCYVDISTIQSVPVKSFELWADGKQFKPRDFYIVGSNDGINFDKMYDNGGINVLTHETSMGPDGETRCYSDVIDLNNSVVYSHIGIFVASAFAGSDFTTAHPEWPVWVQELRLFKQ